MSIPTQQPTAPRTEIAVIAGAAVLALAFLLAWTLLTQPARLALRLPVKDPGEALDTAAPRKSRNPGTLVPGSAKPSDLPGSWPQFRGPDRTNIAHEVTGLARAWPKAGLTTLWRIHVGEGYTGPVIQRGCVYLIDYDQAKDEDAIRCLNLETAQEIWRYTYYNKVSRSHGMSRTTPSVTDDFVVTLGPKCHVTCLNSKTGEPVWKKNLVREHDTTVPGWYAGQCPFIDGDVAIIAPGAKPLLMAVELATGNIRWPTPSPDPDEWLMTHSSVASITVDGVKQYVYCARAGVVGVRASDGRLLWQKDDWTVKSANMPTPVFVPPDRVFLSGGYEAGCTLIRLKKSGGSFSHTEVFRLAYEVFDSPQQTPILYNDHIYAVSTLGGPDARSEMACLTLDGKPLWRSGSDRRFGLGAYMMADGMLFALCGSKGKRKGIHLIQATPDGYRELATAKVLNQYEAWGPMAMAGDLLIVRDLTTMACLKLPKANP